MHAAALGKAFGSFTQIPLTVKRPVTFLRDEFEKWLTGEQDKVTVLPEHLESTLSDPKSCDDDLACNIWCRNDALLVD